MVASARIGRILLKINFVLKNQYVKAKCKCIYWLASNLLLQRVKEKEKYKVFSNGKAKLNQNWGMS